MAMGAVAVASGLLPGGNEFTLGSGSQDDQVRSSNDPSQDTQGGDSGSVVTDRPTTSVSRGTDRVQGPSASPSASPSKPTADKKEAAAPAADSPAADSASPSTGTAKGTSAAKATESSPAATPEAAATTTAPTTPNAGAAALAPATGTDTGTATTAEAAVLTLVNQERAKVGCSPVTQDKALAGLAGAFSDDMAARGFFDHTDPDGKSPWDRAAAAGITNLGGENIARGQADAAAVMDAWMNSPGHRANILNCDYKTLGVGVTFGDGGPWWTQDFGF
jgi:uncharacterized protein YkwD